MYIYLAYFQDVFDAGMVRKLSTVTLSVTEREIVMIIQMNWIVALSTQGYQ